MTFESKRRSFGAPSSTRPPLRGPKGDKGNPGAAGPSGAPGTSVQTYGAVGNGIANDSAAITNALASGADEIFFPAGTYKIGSAVTGSADDQTLTFAPGAVLRIGAGVVFSGDRMRINGLRFELSTASGATFTAVKVSGEASLVGDVACDVSVEVPNVTLLSIQGDSCTVGEMTITCLGSFKRGLELVRGDGTVVKYVRAGAVLCFPEDDSVTTRTYESIVRMRCHRSRVGGVVITSGGRAHITAVIDVHGHHNTIVDPQIDSSHALYGILMRDLSEFLSVFGGEVAGGFLAGSVAVQCGLGAETFPAAGQLKAYDLKIRNWDVGVLFTGTCDSPRLDGCTIANCRYAQIRIDSKRGSDVWPVSALSIDGCYSEANTYPDAPFLHLVSGALEGCTITGSEIGFTETGVLVETTMGVNVVEVHGNRLLAADPADAFATPGEFSTFSFGLNAHYGSNLISKGAYEDNASSIFDPILTGLRIGAENPGSLTNRMVQRFTDIYTANFGNLAAGAVFPLDFAFADVPTTTTAELTVTLSSALGAKAALGIQFQWWIDVSGHIGGCAYNPTAAPINGVSGGVRFTITVFG